MPSEFLNQHILCWTATCILCYILYIYIIFIVIVLLRVLAQTIF